MSHLLVSSLVVAACVMSVAPRSAARDMPPWQHSQGTLIAEGSSELAPGHRPAGTWEGVAQIPYRVQEVYPAAHKGQLWLAGGLSPDVPMAAQSISDQTWVYDPEQDRWAPGPALPEPRHHLYLVSTGDRLYAFGGFIAGGSRRWHASRDVLLLDEGAERWRKVASLLHPQSETVAAWLDGKVYLATGRRPTGERNTEWRDQGDISLMQVFDPDDHSVTIGPPAPTARNSAAGAVIGGRLYVVGGRVVDDGNRASNEVFNPTTGAWKTLSPMPTAQGGIAAAALGGRLYVFGGEYFDDGGGVHRESWVYDPAADRWAPIPPMPVARHGLGAVTLKGAIYVVAGATQVGGAGTSDRLSRFTPK
ncbi:MAG: kelch repeat-containing protein [Pseudomonadota bacterium]